VKNRIPKQPPLSMAIQAAGLRGLFPQGNTAMGRNSISWIGKIATNDYGRSYTLEMRYKQGAVPGARTEFETIGRRQAASSRLQSGYAGIMSVSSGLRILER